MAWVGVTWQSAVFQARLGHLSYTLDIVIDKAPIYHLRRLQWTGESAGDDFDQRIKRFNVPGKIAPPHWHTLIRGGGYDIIDISIRL